ncbi:MAG: hypothetical protein E7549_03900 [Ruminococcaceae bacterium]|nr:hypothetical protein [Oscillospiraceae bacterium]
MYTTTSPPILVYFSDRASCKRLVTAGAALAKEQHRALSLLFVQPQELVSKTVAEDIQTVYNIATREGAEITVLFSDEPLLSLAVHARQTKAVQIVIDESNTAGRPTLAILRTLLPDLPITVLQKGGNAVTFPPSEITTQNRRLHPAPAP